MSPNSSGGNDQQLRRRFLKRSAASLPVFKALASAPAVAALLTAPVPRHVLAASSAEAPDAEVPDEEILRKNAAGLDPMESRRLHLVNAHTKDDLDVVYYTHGIYIDENIEQLNHLMRDRRANVTRSIDPDLYDQLLALQKILGTTEPVHVLSGYRTPETNAKLRKRSSGVAKYSLHMEGRAADIYIPGIAASAVHEAALEMKAGGVGLYSKSNFIHLDTGAVRQWGK